MTSKKLLWQTFDSLLIVFLMTGCVGLPAEPPTSTPLPQTGTITGMIIDANGKPLVDVGDTGYVVLYCPNDDRDVECLHEDYADMDPSVLLDSICEITDRADSCLVHLMTSAAKIGWDGKYTIPVVRPGQYDLILIIVSSGVMLKVHLLNVDSIEAGKITRYDLPMK